MRDVEAFEDFIAHGVPETMLAIVVPLTMSVVLFVLNWKLALIALLPLPVVFLMYLSQIFVPFLEDVSFRGKQKVSPLTPLMFSNGGQVVQDPPLIGTAVRSMCQT